MIALLSMNAMLSWWIFLTMFFHWVGDFVCQTRWMAENKSKRWDALTYHVITYSSVVALGAVGIPMVFIMSSFNLTAPEIPLAVLAISRMTGLFFVITAVLHFVIDAITSRVTSYYREKDMQRHFWAMIGFDQFLHFICLTKTLVFVIAVELLFSWSP